MTAQTLFSKPKAPGPSLVRPPSDIERLAGWIARGQHERFSVETPVTPEMATYLLARNAENRVASPATVEAYAAAMRRGEWELNGQNLIVAETGELNDGQHRLLAVIEAGIHVAMGIQFGVARATRGTLDVGRKRTLGDHFTMAGYKNANAIAAAIRLAWGYDNQLYSFSVSPTVEQAMEYIGANPTLADYLNPGARVAAGFGISAAHVTFAGFVCGRVSGRVTEELLARIHDGVGLTSSNDPAARVRERFIQHSSGRAPLRRNEVSAVVIKAFNAQLGGRRMRSLSWSPTGPQAESFPIAGA